MTHPGFWDDQDASKKVIDENNALKDITEGYRVLEEQHENLEVSYELVKEEDDEVLKEELE